MAFSTTAYKIEYTGNGSLAGPYPFPYFLSASTDLTVSLSGVIQSSGFTATGSGIAWNVTFDTAPASAVPIILKRSTTNTSPTDYVDLDQFPADTFEADLDRRTAVSQETSGLAQNSLRYDENEDSIGDDETILPLRSIRASTALGWDALGNVTSYPLESSGTTAALVTESVATAGQTLINTAGYSPGLNLVSVYINGAKLLSSDYAEVSGSVTLTEGLFLGDSIRIEVNEVQDVVSTGAAGTTSFTQTGTGAVATNVQDKLEERVSVKDFGATGAGGTYTTEIQAAMDAHDHVYFPDGTYSVKDLVPNNNQILEFESSDAILSGVVGTDDIFATTGAIIQIRVFGGSFSDCANVWTHTGTSSLAYCLFEGMKINDCTDGFNLSTSVGNTWRDCNFGTNGSADNIVNGVNFLATSSGQTNLNRFSDCNFFFYSGSGITFADTAIVKTGNTITRCWFEDGTANAIYIGGTSRSLSIRDSYFENNGGAGIADILLEQSTGSSTNEIHIDRCTFEVAATGQTYRIRNTGNTYIDVKQCTATLPAGCVFVAVDGTTTFHSSLLGNYINAIGAGSYESRLFSQSGTQALSWSVEAPGGLVTEDDRPYAHKAGGQGFEVYTLANEATPSVQGKKLCKSGGTTTVTDFDDGRLGQTITLMAEHAVTITDNAAIILNGSANFVMASGDSLTLTMFNDQIWQETSRMVNL